MPQLSLIQQIAVWAIPVLFAITLHEASHAFVAHRLGDSTAKALGRLTLNPFKHVDLVGTIILPLLVAVLSNFNFVFGYAKPVPVNWRQLHNPRRDAALVTIAGPLSNFIMAFLWAACFKLSIMLNPQSSNLVLFLLLMAQAGIIINLVLAFLNLIPIPPLDGSRVVNSLLPPKYSDYYLKLEPFGFLILILLLFTGLLGAILLPLLKLGLNVIRAIFNL
ncbi:site-2 protease family protein [Legionella israelensis]|uniref:Transmembrane protein n=1 Tax=Legionella israelensis TaxID=454 RepID=A0A0W0VK84_9GAMM|nr:site-2 protease family protein [Legionella israelensis]KTD20513.1 transmembrane protein [Legionella israelensis]QBS10810.1 site-2 protease family protein [Legionella israelensis]QDP72975.1 site-2 protease family protein [Legionella israelensis]SCX85966.1 Zn-dependent protease (includes SpoIVFB) [Legionella israelensis DSM 19235]STX57786.1 transmembrane protein [Legionella israelensis]